MLPKDILQIIGMYSNTDDFIKLYELYNVSIDVFLKYTKNRYFVHSNHKFMDYLIQKNILSDENVCDYALKYDIPKYIQLRNNGNNARGGICAHYKTHTIDYYFIEERIPNIVKHNYMHKMFRCKKSDLRHIFLLTDLELLKNCIKK